MEDIKFLDVVKWNHPMSKPEKDDVMVVEDTDKDAITVRHLQDNNVTTVFARDLRVVGRCTPYEPIKDIVSRYVTK